VGSERPFLATIATETTTAIASGQTMITRTVETNDDEPGSDFLLAEGGWRRPFLASRGALATGAVLGATRFTKTAETSDDEPQP
jgi:hypothetical protein